MSSKIVRIAGLALGAAVLCTCGDSSEVMDDGALPALVASSLSSDRAGSGDVIELTLEVSEELAEAPVVTLQFASPKPMSSAGDTAPYQFTYTVSGDEEEGQVLIRASMKDLSDNVGDVGVGGITFDFTGPTTDVINLGGTRYLKSGRTGVVSFVVDDALGSGGVASFTNSGTLDGTALEYLVTDSGRPAFTYVATGDEPEGATAINLELTDVVGNTATSGPFDAFIFDFTAPEIDGTAAITLDYLDMSEGHTVEIHFTSTEELDWATVTMRHRTAYTSASLDLEAGAGENEWIASRQLAAHAPFSAGEWDLEATLVDLADNRTNDIYLGFVTVVD